MNKLFNFSGVMSCCCRTLHLIGFLLAGTIGIGAPAFAAQTIADGTYVSGSVYSYGTPHSYATGGSGNINYISGALNQTGSVVDPLVTSVKASSIASLSNNKLSLSLSGGTGGTTQATAEMWDTLTFGNLPGPGTVTANTVLGTLNMTVTGSIGSATYVANGYAAGYGLSLYNSGSFLQPTIGGCGYLDGACGGWVASSGLGSTPFVPGTQTFSVGITKAELASGSLSFIAEIQAANFPTTFNAPLVIDPSVTLTGLYSGVTVSSDSGYNYSGGSVSAVPEPETYAMLLSGLGLIGFVVYRRKDSSSAMPMAV